MEGSEKKTKQNSHSGEKNQRKKPAKERKTLLLAHHLIFQKGWAYTGMETTQDELRNLFNHPLKCSMQKLSWKQELETRLTRQKMYFSH